MKKIVAFVTNHGHMDIEWYQPLDNFRWWMTEAVEILMRLREEGSKQSYIFDGAFYPVEEVLEVHPEYEEKIRALIRDGALAVGPFYTQFDEFLNSGETLIENCLWGDRRSKAFGGVMKAGYLPDNFGHPSQLPQILKDFGIDDLLFTRGMPQTESGKKEFFFVGDDGSKIFGVNFAYYATFSIYSNNDPLPGLPLIVPGSAKCLSDYQTIREISEHKDHKKIAEELIKNVLENAKFYPSGIVPVFTGCDHCPPQEGILETLELANSMQDEIEFVFGDGNGYSKLLRENFSDKADPFRGDLLGLKTDYLLLGAMSSRNYLKRRHDRCERLVFDYALPAHALAEIFGISQPETMLGDAVKKLLINSTHDTIHGSSVDDVHVEQEYRYSSIEQNAGWTLHDALEKIGRRMSAPAKDLDGSIVVFSPVGTKNGVCEAYITTFKKNVSVFDSHGRKVPSEIIPNEPMEYNVNGDPALTASLSDDVRRVRFSVSGGDTAEQYGYSLSGDEVTVRDFDGREIENEFFTVKFINNTVSVLDKESGAVYDGLNQLAEAADDGDIWDYSEPWTEQKTYSQADFPAEKVSVTKGELSSTLSYSFTMLLPEGIKNGRRSETLLPSPISFQVTLYKNIRRVDVALKILNRSRDHCVRLRIPGAKSENGVVSGGLFTVRQLDPSRYLDCENLKTASDREMPFRDFLCFGDPDKTLVTAVKGLYTYEYKNGAVEIPLFRSVGRMTKPNMKGRKSGRFASSVRIEGAQCLRELDFEFSFVPLAPGEKLSSCLERVDSFLRPPLAHTMRHTYGGDLPAAISPVEIEKPQSVLVSAFRKSIDCDGAILRIYETLGESAEVRLKSKYFSGFFVTTMNEDSLAPLIKDPDDSVTLSVGPHKIMTVMMKR
ncbi:MAG: hypothetical protein IJV00_09810 [Clostridia bacterium]|nr:hypothetical protein [Clostridia bacterium]